MAVSVSPETMTSTNALKGSARVLDVGNFSRLTRIGYRN